MNPKLTHFALALFLMALSAQASADDTRYVSTASEWDAAFSTGPNDPDVTAVRVLLTEDIWRDTPGNFHSSGNTAYNVRLNPAKGWTGNHTVVLDCQHHRMEWAGPDQGVAVFRLKDGSAANFLMKNCVIADSGGGSDTEGIRFGYSTGGRIEFDRVRSQGFGDPGDQFFKIDSYFYQWVVYDSEFSTSGGDTGALVDVTFEGLHEYNNMIRDSLFATSPSLPAQATWCMRWKNSTKPTSVTAQGNQYYLCRGFDLDGVYLLSTGDYFNGLGGFVFQTSENVAPFRIGTESPSVRGGIKIAGGVLDAWHVMPRYLFDARSWEYIDVDMAAALVPDVSTVIGCGDDDGLFGPFGAILHGDPGGSPGRITFRMTTPRTTDGEQCFIGDGDPRNFLTANAQAMCGGSNGRCTGVIEGIGLGKWKVRGSSLAMQPYDYNVRGNGVMSGSSFCDSGPGGNVVAGLSCAGVVDAGTGGSVAGGCASILSDGDHFDVECE